MTDQAPITIEELKRRRAVTLKNSERAVLQQPETYKEIKSLIREVICRPIDISEYYSVASRLKDLLQTLVQTQPETIFQYFYQHIDPRQNGHARYFRFNCRDLADQIEKLDQWRIQEHQLKRIK